MYKETIKSMVFREWNIINCNWIHYRFTVHKYQKMVPIPTKPWYILLPL